jgi:hypothetical protein
LRRNHFISKPLRSFSFHCRSLHCLKKALENKDEYLCFRPMQRMAGILSNSLKNTKAGRDYSAGFVYNGWTRKFYKSRIEVPLP